MNWTAFIVGIIFFSVGITTVIFARRFGAWLTRYTFRHNLNDMMPEYNRETSSMDEEEYAQSTIEGKGFHRTFWRVWLTLIRIIAAMLTLGGIFLLAHALFGI